MVMKRPSAHARAAPQLTTPASRLRVLSELIVVSLPARLVANHKVIGVDRLVEKRPADKLVLGKMDKFNCWLRCAGGCPRVVVATLVLMAIAVPPLRSREKNRLSYGEGLIVNLPSPESEVAQVVQDVAQNGIIRGTKEYNKDEYVAGAKAADSTRVFPPWTEGGKVFYKVRLQALDPRNFKDSGDLGTLAVRYVVKPQGDKNTVLRIDALFVEDFRHTVHASNGSVETSEYKDIRDRIEEIEVMKQQTVEAESERQQLLKKKVQAQNNDGGHTTVPAAAPSVAANDGVGHDANAARQVAIEPIAGQGQISSSQPVSHQTVSNQAVPSQTTPGPTGSGQLGPGQAGASQIGSNQTGSNQPSSNQTLEQHVQDLRHQVERLVKEPGAPLKSAPFHTASTLSPLATGTEVLILIATPYWYGVETRDGQHGWVFRDELEPLP